MMRFLQFSRGFSSGFALLGLLAAVWLGGCSGKEQGKKRIIILTNGNSPDWDACAKGAEDASRELKLENAGYQFEIQQNDLSDKGQIDKLKSYATAGDIAAVGISVTDENNIAIVEAMKDLQAAGVKVITIDSDLNRETHRDARAAYIGTDNVIAGRELGKAAKVLVGEGDYMAFVGLKGAANAQGRIKGFDEGVGQGIKRKSYLEDKDSNKAAQTVTGILTPNLETPPKLLLGIWSYNTPAIVETVDKLGLADEVTIVGFDAEPNTITYIGQGKVDALLVQNPYQMGYVGVKLLRALAEDDQTAIKEILPSGSDTYTTDLKIVVPDGDTRLSKDLFNEDTQFMPLGEFREWLKKYGLTGS
jgi:ribose transport system substrate-binding protein